MNSLQRDSECPICGCSSQGDVFSPLTPIAGFGIENDPIRSMFHPTSFHWECFWNWPFRLAFGDDQFERRLAKRELCSLNGRLYMSQCLAVFVSVTEPFRMTVIVRITGREFVIGISDWLSMVANLQQLSLLSRDNFHPNALNTRCQDQELEQLICELPKVFQQFPDVASIDRNTDWGGSERNLYRDDADRPA